MKLTTHIHLMLRVKNEWIYTSTPHLCLHGVNGDNSLQSKTLLLMLVIMFV